MYVNGPTNDETTASDPAPSGRISQRANPYAYSDPDLLGFSLKPPKFVRKIGSALKKPAALIGAAATLIPLPGGSIASRVVGSTVGKLFKRGQQIDRTVKNVVQRVAVSPVAAPLPIPVAVIRAGESTAPTADAAAPTASPTGGVVPEVAGTPALERTAVATVTKQKRSAADRILRGAQKLAGNVDKARAAADSLSKAAAAAADAGDELGAKRLAAQARAISEGAAQVSSGASQASGAITGAAEGAITGAAAATASDQVKEFLSTTTGKVVAGGAVLGGVLLLTSGKGGSTQSWR